MDTEKEKLFLKIKSYMDYKIIDEYKYYFDIIEEFEIYDLVTFKYSFNGNYKKLIDKLNYIDYCTNWGDFLSFFTNYTIHIGYEQRDKIEKKIILEFSREFSEMLVYIEEEEIKFNIYTNIIQKPENVLTEIEAYSKETGKGKNIPYKLALLRELGVLDTLNTKYDNNNEQLYRILDFLTGGNSKNYYLSMYGDDYNGKDKVTRSHYAYLRNNGLI